MCVQKGSVANLILSDDSVPGGCLPDSRFLNRIEGLFHNFRMKDSSRVKWDDHPACTLRVDSVATLRAQQVEIRGSTVPSPPREQSTEEV